MASNYVEIRVKASDEAKPDLTDLKLKLDELGSKVETAKVDVADEAASEKLLRLNAKLAELNAKVANPKIKVAGAARAEADLLAVEHQLDALSRKADEIKVKADTSGPGGLLGRLFLGGGSGGGGGSSLLAGGLGSPAGIGAIAASLTALLPEVVALVSGFTAAGAGAGSFAILAEPAIKKVETAYTNLSAAQQKYQDAQAKYNEDPTKSNATALQAAALGLDLVKDKLRQLPQSEQDALGGIRSLTSEFGKLSRAFEPEAFKVFSGLLTVADNLLPAITPLATSFANALTGLLKQLAGFTQSSGFQQWLSQFGSLVGPATTAIGQGIGKVAIAVGQLLTVFSGNDVANGISIAFGAAAGIINGVRLAIEWLKTAWDRLSQDPAVKRIVGDIETAWSDISTTGKKKPDFSGLTTAVQDAVNTAVAWLSKKLTPLIDGVLQSASTWLSKNVGPLMAPIGKGIIDGIISGIESNLPSFGKFLGGIATFIAEHKGPLDYDRQLLVPHGQAIMRGLMDGMASRMPDLRSDLAGISQTISGGTGRAAAGGYGAAGGGGTVRVQLEWVGGDSEIFRALRQGIRIRGGNVQTVLGHG